MLTSRTGRGMMDGNRQQAMKCTVSRTVRHSTFAKREAITARAGNVDSLVTVTLITTISRGRRGRSCVTVISPEAQPG